MVPLLLLDMVACRWPVWIANTSRNPDWMPWTKEQSSLLALAARLPRDQWRALFYEALDGPDCIRAMLQEQQLLAEPLPPMKAAVELLCHSSTKACCCDGALALRTTHPLPVVEESPAWDALAMLAMALLANEEVELSVADPRPVRFHVAWNAAPPRVNFTDTAVLTRVVISTRLCDEQLRDIARACTRRLLVLCKEFSLPSSMLRVLYAGVRCPLFSSDLAGDGDAEQSALKTLLIDEEFVATDDDSTLTPRDNCFVAVSLGGELHSWTVTFFKSMLNTAAFDLPLNEFDNVLDLRGRLPSHYHQARDSDNPDVVNPALARELKNASNDTWLINLSGCGITFPNEGRQFCKQLTPRRFPHLRLLDLSHNTLPSHHQGTVAYVREMLQKLPDLHIYLHDSLFDEECLSELRGRVHFDAPLRLVKAVHPTATTLPDSSVRVEIAPSALEVGRGSQETLVSPSAPICQ